MFLVFFGFDYYPREGWKDFRDAFPTIHKAMTYIATQDGWDWYQVVDLSKLSIVRSGTDIVQAEDL